MPSDREDLRERVNELEATVRGLTQELVEANERIRVLEGEDEAASEADKPMPSKDENPSEETETATETEEQDEGDDIIVA